MVNTVLKNLWIHAARQMAGCRNALQGLNQALQAGCAQLRPAISRCIVSVIKNALPATGVAVTTLIMMATATPSFAAPLHGDKITNRAYFNNNLGSSSQTSVDVTIVLRTPSKIEFFNYIPSPAFDVDYVNEPVSFTEYRDSNGNFVTMGNPMTSPPIDLTVTKDLNLTSTGVYHQGEAIFIRLRDFDQNLDRNVAEKILATITNSLTRDTEELRLTETGPGTGVFTGYIQSTSGNANLYDGAFQVRQGDIITVTYTDIYDTVRTSTAEALVDPLGIVFDSRSGQPINGATITLWQIEPTNGPANVKGDDALSYYPETVISGDSTIYYDFDEGHYRFPFVAPGIYELRVTPPAGYTLSTVDNTILQALRDVNGNPFFIVMGSKNGEQFPINPGPAIRIDIPLDPPDTGMRLQKNSGKPTAGIGDFVPYELTLQNFNTVLTSTGVVIDDLMPRGLRYIPGSTTIDGLLAADPTISKDGRTLNFNLGNVAPATTVRIRYVVEVSAGAKPGRATNIASARDSIGPISKPARANIEIKDDFLRSRSIILGNVYQGACGDFPGSEASGLAGVRIYMEDGNFAVTDEAGRYHFEGVQPGLHVLQLDPDTIPDGYEIAPCEESNRFAGAGNSQFVDLTGGTLWRADFQVGVIKKEEPPVITAPLAPLAGLPSLRLTSNTDGERYMKFTVSVTNTTSPLFNSKLLITLPTDVTYLPGTSELSAAAIADPVINGQVLTYDLNEIYIDARHELTFQGQFDPLTIKDDPTVTAILKFDNKDNVSLSTSEASNNYRIEPNFFSKDHQFIFYPHFDSGQDTILADDRIALDKIANEIKGWQIKKIVIVGHTDSQRLSPKTKKRFRDNMGLSRARASAIADYIGGLVDLSGVDLLKVGMGPTVPIASNAIKSGMALNRRVEMQIETTRMERQARILPVITDSGEKAVDTNGILHQPNPVPAVEPPSLITSEAVDVAKPELRIAPSAAYAAPSTEKAVGILSPAADSTLVSAVNVVRIRLDSKLKPQVLVDGVEVPAKRIGFTMADPETKKTLYSYIGVDFGKPGNHEVVVRGLDPFGNARFTEKIQVQRSGEIRTIRQIETGENIADGKTPIRVRIEMIDENGVIIQAPVAMEFTSDQLRPQQTTDDLYEVKGKGLVAKIGADGWINFSPTSTTGLYRAFLNFNDLKVELTTYVKPHLRDWILVGLAEGTVGYNTLSGNIDPLQDGDIKEDFYNAGRLAFFAKGKVKGEWLLTAAYDTGKEHEDRLHGLIRPETYYTLYGDNTQPFADAPSSRKLYVKLEREQFYALFGDYDTGLTVTELSRYSRSLTGFKTEYVGDKVSLKAFAADTNQSYVRDEIPGDGTSGLYRLSTGSVVLNSEKITLEIRDRFHSEVVLTSKSLTRNLDYDLDYSAGTLFFKEAIPSRDENLNPVHIVVEYESLLRQQSSLEYGGRVAVKPFGENVEIGASYIHEGSKRDEGQLAGIDATIKLNEETTVNAEFASTSKTTNNVELSGSAWLAQIDHRNNDLEGRVYARQSGEGFGLGQQANSEQSTRKIGGMGRYNLSEIISIGGEISRDSNLTSGSDRDMAQIEVKYNKDKYSIGGGLRQAIDHLAGGGTNSSTQIFANSSMQASTRLKLRLSHDQSIASQGEAADYPTRTILGADYQLSERTAVFGEQEFTFGENENSNMTRIGLKATPWNGAQAQSTMEQQSTEYGPRVFAAVGLKQTWQIDNVWSADASLDRSQTLRHPGNPIFDGAPPVSGGAEDFTAISLGANRKAKNWIWSNRIEQRFSDNEDKFGIFTGAEGDVREGVAVSGKFQLFNTHRLDGQKQQSGDVRFGLAYRPAKTRWIVLDRLEFLFDRQSGSSFDFSNLRVVNNLNANYRPNWKSQVSLQYGFKYVTETIDGRNYDGFTDLIGIEGRHDFAKKWDVGLQGQVLHSWQSNQYDYRVAPSVGYLFMKNMWLSGGYNLVGFQDADFSAADFTAQGPFVKFRFKFDQNSVREALKQF